MYAIAGDKRPEMNDLIIYVVDDYATEWERIGLALKFKPGRIKTIHEDNANRKEGARKSFTYLLSEWLEMDTTATYGKLYDAIHNRTFKGGKLMSYCK